jgi:hypothetical protein
VGNITCLALLAFGFAFLEYSSTCIGDFDFNILKGSFIHQSAHLLKKIGVSDILSKLFVLRRAAA